MSAGAGAGGSGGSGGSGGRSGVRTQPPTLAPMDRLERLTDLVLVLLREGPPRTLAEIADEVPGYPPAGEARRQAFERDKRTLRDQGIAVTTAPVAGPEQLGYQIRPEDFYLPDLALEPDEQVALNLAVAAVHMGDGIGRQSAGQQALWRLGLPGGPGPAAVAALPAVPALPAVFEAIRTSATLSFAYRGARRQVAPAQLRFHRGRWYLVGYDLDRQAARTFRVDRMEGGPDVGAPGSRRLPDGFDPDAPWSGDPWQAGDEPTVVVDLLVDAVVAPRVERDVGTGAVAERRPDGSLVLRLDVTNLDALRAWVLELGEHAEVLAPPAVRHDLVRWLEAVAHGAVADGAEAQGAEAQGAGVQGAGVQGAGSEGAGVDGAAEGGGDAVAGDR